MDDERLFAWLAEGMAAGTPAALATVIHTRGHCPREVGAKMVVLRDGRIFGTIGGGCGEAAVRTRALDVMDAGLPLVCTVDLRSDPALPESATCGGIMEVFIEPVQREGR